MKSSQTHVTTHKLLFFVAVVTAIFLITPMESFGQTATKSITLSWTASGDDGSTGTATVYDIRYSTSLITDANWNAAIQVTNEPTPQLAGSSESLVIDSLEPNSTYYFAIKTADEADNWSVLSNVISKTTEVESVVPALVADLSTGTATTSSMVLQWTAVGDDSLTGTASQYDIRYSTLPITNANFFSATPVTGEPTPQIAGSSETFTVTELTINTQYYFALRTADDVPNWSEISNVASGSTANESTAPAAIASLVVSNPTDSSATLTWTAPGDDDNSGQASQYEIRYSTSSITNSNWSSATVVSNPPTPMTAGGSESFIVTGLNQEITYYFAIKTADEVPNWSDLSNVVSTTTLDLTPPASINDLAATTGTVDGTILLDWTAPGDDNMLGSASLYEIRYSQNEITDSNWLETSLFMPPPLPLPAGEHQSITLTGLTPGQVYHSAIKSYDNKGNPSAVSNYVSAEAAFNLATDIDDNDNNLPTEFALAQNYPNPFNPSTTIGFSMPTASYVELTIYNVEGKAVKTLVEQNLSAGKHSIEWDGTNNSGSQIATGFYIYRITSETFSATKKMVLIK